MRVILADGQELKIKRLHCNLNYDSQMKAVDTFEIEHEEIISRGLNEVGEMFTSDNIKHCTFVRGDGETMTRDYKYIYNIQHIFDENNNLTTVMLTNKEKDTNKEGFYQ